MKTKKYDFPVIAHTHWDREWYFTTSRSKVYSLNHFKEVFDTLETNKKFKHFLLDAQLSVIDDYLKYHPYDEERIKKLVREGKLIVGPIYTQTDQMVVSGESIIRNFYYGIKRAKYFGEYMKSGYTPDAFGQSAQMPQILNGFDIKYNTFKRGFGEKHYPKNEFYWKSPDGSIVFNVYLDRYGNFVYFQNTDESLTKISKELKQETDDRSLVSTLTLYNGEDQRPIRHNLPKVLERLNELNPDSNFYFSTIEEIAKKLENNGYEYDTIEGEMSDTQYSRVHKSIFSNRADLKIKNNKLENYITNVSEPLNSIAYKLGFEYENYLFEEVWKTMALNAAHDSIGMCNSDETNLDIEQRLNITKSLLENLNELKMREIGSSLKNINDYQFQVYNLLPYNRSFIGKIKIYSPQSEGFKILDLDGKEYNYQILNCEKMPENVIAKMKREIGFNGDDHPKWLKENFEVYEIEMNVYFEDINSMGYKTFLIEQGTNIKNDKTSKNQTIENEYLSVTIEEDSSVTIKNKITNEIFNNFLIIENSGDDGDSYDYSEPYEDRIIDSKNAKIEIIKTTENEIIKKLNIN